MGTRKVWYGHTLHVDRLKIVTVNEPVEDGT